ncbi:MAG: DUF2934 domain-containing protein [Azonexus sp.]|nr:DUF2934 domain-containing protein [Azonexus sp.]MDZ4315918.1 DUF2934 domain-containing protein [Azonexus sp.]
MKTAETVGQAAKKSADVSAQKTATTTKTTAGHTTMETKAGARVNAKKQHKLTAGRIRSGEPYLHQMIQAAAYSRYEKRGFEQGNELQDWLDAEREVRQMTDVERQAETF